jgi:translation initiation factor 1A
MPANTHGGKKYKKGKKSDSTIRPITLKEDEQYYARVNKLLGGDRVIATIETTKKPVMCHVRGAMKKKKQWVNPSDIVLITEREFQAGKFDIIAKYSQDEVRELRRLGHINGTSFDNDDDKKYSNIKFIGDDVNDDFIETEGKGNIAPQNRSYDLPSSDEEETEDEKDEEYEEEDYAKYTNKPSKKNDGEDSDIDIDDL